MANFADVSHHQGSIDWDRYARSGRDRVMIKATQGGPGNEQFIDPLFAINWRGAKAAGLMRGAYHFAEAETSGAAQWAFFKRIVDAAGGFGPNDWADLDAEDNDSATGVSRADEFCGEFCRAATSDGVAKGTLYTARFYAQPGNITAIDLPPGWRWLHYADYTAGQPDNQIEIPTGWTREQVSARQYTDRATVPGITNPCDDSRILHEWLGTTTPTKENDVSLKDLQDFFNATEIAIPSGQSNNNNIFRNLTGMGQSEVNRDAAEATALRSLATGVTDTRSAVLALAQAVNTVGLTDSQVQGLADKLAPLLPHVDAAELAAAFGTRLVNG